MSLKRITLFSILVCVGSLGLISFGFIKQIVVTENIEYQNGTSRIEKLIESFETIVQAIRYCSQEHFILLMIIQMYIGLELAFFQTIFPTAVGATKIIPDSTRLVGLIACLVGVGEIFGSLISGFLSKYDLFRRGPLAAGGLFTCLFVCCLFI